MKVNKRYFKCLKINNGIIKIDYWHTANISLIINSYDFIIPLGYKKPKVTDIKEG